jgi:uncharacterized protein (DUF2252 family)
MVQIRSGTLAERHQDGVHQDGVRLRRKTSREKHADLRGATDRDAVAILRATDRTRVPELMPVRCERMSASPFAFLGAAAGMAEDLRHEPTAGIPVQACGDCRTSGHSLHRNRTSCSTSIISTRLSGVDFTADLKRLAASVAVAALAANLSKKQARAIAATTVEAYRTHLRSLARRSPLES